jgi:hypothetical protein
VGDHSTGVEARAEGSVRRGRSPRCEVLAIPNLLSGRRDQIGCIAYTPIDRAEASRRCEPG